MSLPADVLACIERSFPPPQQAQARAMLAAATIEDGSAASPRLLRCAVVASCGDVTQLQRLVALLAVDWRDVIVAAEYALRGTTAMRIRDLDQPLQD